MSCLQLANATFAFIKCNLSKTPNCERNTVINKESQVIWSNRNSKHSKQYRGCSAHFAPIIHRIVWNIPYRLCNGFYWICFNSIKIQLKFRNVQYRKADTPKSKSYVFCRLKMGPKWSTFKWKWIGKRSKSVTGVLWCTTQ